MSANHWRIHKGTIAQWTAQIPMPGDPERLLGLTRQLIAAAYATEIGLFVKDGSGTWTADELVESIGARFRATGAVDFFEFSKGHMRVRSRVAYWRGDAIEESVIADLKELLCTVQPDAMDDWLPHHPREPVQIQGHPVHYRDDADLFSAKQLPSISFTLKTTSDIWFPWVRRFTEDQFFDNRALAARHTTRLDRFLVTLSKLASDHGGRLEFSAMLEEDWVHQMAGPDGIQLLDAPPR